MSEDHSATRMIDPSNLDRYRHHIAHLGLPREREDEMMAVLHAYLAGCVDRAFGHDPIQLVAGDRLRVCDEGSIRPVIASEPITNPTHHDLSGAFEDASAPGQRKR